MPLAEFQNYPLWANLGMFAAAAAAVWFAGSRLARYAASISDRTGIGAAFLGLILLGGITSLPEIAVTVTASLAGSAALSVNNLLGGVAAQFVVLAIADAVHGRDAISSVVGKPVMLLQGTFCILLLIMAAAGIIMGDTAVFGVGLWAWGILVLYIGFVWLINRYQGSRAWIAGGTRQKHLGHERSSAVAGGQEPRGGDATLGRIVFRTVLAAIVILVAGYVLARTGDAIAGQTGIGASFVGAVLLGVATSLPEVSTVVSAVHLRHYAMAFSNIFGGNLFDLMLVFVVDAVYAGGPVLNEVGRFSSLAALLGIALTAIYLAGLLERSDRAVFRIGLDSMAALVVYLGGLALLYQLR